MSITLTHKTTKTIVETSEEVIEHHDMVTRIHDQILAYGPHSFDMDNWFHVTRHSDEDKVGRYGLEAVLSANSAVNLGHCGTTGCLAGHATAWLAGNGLTDLVKMSDSSWDNIDQGRIATLLGMRVGSFNSEYYSWHPIVQAAYKNDIAIQANEYMVAYVDRSYYEEEDTRGPVRGTVEMVIDGDQGDFSHVFPVGGGDTIEWNEWMEDTKHHAQWVAMLTYLRWIAANSRTMHWNGTPDQVSNEDLDLIRNSPAFCVHEYTHVTF
jgi:hypothetical protein